MGISKYPQTGKKPWRRLSTHQDVVQIKEALKAHGFLGDDILVLEDDAATAKGIRAAFKTHLIAPAKPGDTLFFHFSGHGQQVIDDNGDELDGLDETLVPVDATEQNAAEGAKTNLRDDEIGAWLATLGEKLRGADGKQLGSVTVTLDSCFSGSTTRSGLGERGHGWDLEIDGPTPPRRDIQRSGRLLESFLDRQIQAQVLSAGLSTQTAKERDGMGVFSRALSRALLRADSRTTYRALMDDIEYELALSGIRDQTPGLEGDGDLLLFRGEARKAERTTRVLAVNGDRLTIAAGSLHLVTLGSIYEVHRTDSTKLDDNHKLGDAEVISVDTVQSVLKLRKGLTKPGNESARRLLLQSHVIESEHCYVNSPLRVRLSGLPAELEKALRAIPVISVQQATEPQYDVEVRANHQEIRLIRAESTEAFAQTALDTGAVAALDTLLRGEWRWRTVATLRADDPAAQVHLRLVPVQCPAGPAAIGQILPERTDLPKQAILRLVEDDCFQIELRNSTRNDLWVTVLQLSADGSIEPSFPHPRLSSEHLIKYGETVRVRTPYLYKVQLAPGQTFERSMFKVIATTQPIDLSPLIQQAYELSKSPIQNRGPARIPLEQKLSAVPVSLAPLARLLTQAMLGERREATFSSALDAWGVTTTALDQEVRVKCDDKQGDCS